MSGTTKIEITTGTILKVVIILLAVGFLYLISDIVILLFLSVILVSAMEPAVDYFQIKKIPRALTVGIIYILILAIIGVTVSFLVPPLVKQIQELGQNFSQYSSRIESWFGPFNNFLQNNRVNFGTSQILGNFGNALSSFSANIFSETIGVFSGLFSLIIVFVMAFYMSVEEDGIKKFIVSVVPRKHQSYASDLTERIKYKIGKWLLGQLLIMFIIFVLDAVGLWLVGVPYALILGIFSGIMEAVPYVGPIISAIPGVILGFMISPTVGLLAFLVYFIAQQIEGNVVVPIVMKKVVGLNPVVIILALLIGVKLGGILGAVISIPVVTSIELFVQDLMESRNEAAAT